VRPLVYLERLGSVILPYTKDEVPDEVVLIQRAKDFDNEAWRQIYYCYYPKIYAYLLRRLGNTDLAEDMAANVFLHAVEGINSFRWRGFSLSSWFFRIAHNQVVDHFRRKARARIKTEPLTEELLAKISNGQDATEAIFVKDKLKLALESITDDQRQVVLLKFFEGLSNAEVARIIKKSEGAVKGLQHRALASLKCILGKEDRSGKGL
jgi:RNA polymerase sigma-70 factor (ECF subfamily)